MSKTIDQFVRIRRRPHIEPGCRFRLEYTEELGIRLIDETTLPEQVDNPDARNVKYVSSVAIGNTELEWVIGALQDLQDVLRAGQPDKDMVGTPLTDDERLVYAAAFARDCAEGAPELDSTQLSAQAAAWTAVTILRGDKTTLKAGVDWNRVREMYADYVDAL